jgi:hypothetical protein
MICQFIHCHEHLLIFFSKLISKNCHTNQPYSIKKTGSPATATIQRQEAHCELPDALLSPSTNRSLKILHDSAVIHPRIPQGGFHIFVTQNSLHTKNGHTSIEKLRSACVT